MNKPIKITLSIAFIIIVVLSLFFAYSLYVTRNNSIISDINVVTDSVTGKPIPQEEIIKIQEQQKKDKIYYSITGVVVSKTHTSITFTKLEGGNISVQLLSGGNVIKTENGDEKIIKIEDVNIGEEASVVFQKGITESQILANGTLSVGNIYISQAKTNIGE